MAEWPRILPVGDQALLVEFGEAISPEINDRVYDFAASLQAIEDPRLGELVPTYRSLLVQYDAAVATYDEMHGLLSPLLDRTAARDDRPSAPRKVHQLPVAYGGEYGPDLESVAAHAGLAPERVIEIHSGVAYRVYMIGFAPGFPYLGGMDPAIACPRLATPRTRVPAGSVGIAESQTGVYPNDSPGGWQLIGRTPVRLFDPSQEPPAVIQPGSFVQFKPISVTEFETIAAKVESGDYMPTVIEVPQ